MEVEILDANYDDPLHRAAIIELVDSYSSDPIGQGVPLSAEVRERLVPVLRDHPTSMVLLAFVAGHPAGIAVCFGGVSTFQARPLINVHDLAVVPGHRGQGIGRALLEAVEARAIRQGCCKLTLEVQDQNTRARGLYESFGFADFEMGTAVGTRFLAKSLRTPAERKRETDKE